MSALDVMKFGLAKSEDCLSVLYELLDFKGTRSGDRLGKQYLEGSFGAEPKLNPWS